MSKCFANAMVDSAERSIKYNRLYGTCMLSVRDHSSPATSNMLLSIAPGVCLGMLAGARLLVRGQILGISGYLRRVAGIFWVTCVPLMTRRMCSECRDLGSGFVGNKLIFQSKSTDSTSAGVSSV